LGRYCRRHGRADACVVEQIRAELAVLRAPAASRERKRLAVMYLVHFVGDVHQPLHCAAELDSAGRSDRGGNLKSVYVGGFSEPTNLHALWDGLLYAGRGRPPSARALAKDLEKDLAGKDVAAWTRGDVVSQAALESFALARDKVYPAYRKDGGRVSLAEEESLRPIVDERLERAGVRLAFLLDQSFR
jgi:hypothetical protein